MQNLEQRSAEWHQWRRGGIGSSEAAILMGLTEYKSVETLWAEKVGLQEPINLINEDMQRGIDHEDLAIALYCEQVGLQYEPITIQHPNLSFLRASLDGACMPVRKFCEVKCPRPHIHQKTKTEQYVKPEYYCQIQHQYLATGLESADFISYCVETKDLVWFGVPPDYQYQAELLDREIMFWDSVQNKTKPDHRDFYLWVPNASAQSCKVF